MWQRQITLQQLNDNYTSHILAHLGIKFTALTDHSIEGTMPVDYRTMQPFGLLHGGASVVLAETLGSVAGYLCCHEDEQIAGLEVSASHVRAVKSGQVKGICQPIRIGKQHQVWQINLYDDKQHLFCQCRLTTVILKKSTSS